MMFANQYYGTKMMLRLLHTLTNQKNGVLTKAAQQKNFLRTSTSRFLNTLLCEEFFPEMFWGFFSCMCVLKLSICFRLGI